MNILLIRVIRKIFHVFFKLVFLIFFVCELREDEQVLYVFPIQPIGKQLPTGVYMLGYQLVDMQSVVRRELIRQNDLYSVFFESSYILCVEPLYFINII